MGGTSICWDYICRKVILSKRIIHRYWIRLMHETCCFSTVPLPLIITMLLRQYHITCWQHLAITGPCTRVSRSRSWHLLTTIQWHFGCEHNSSQICVQTSKISRTEHIFPVRNMKNHIIGSEVQTLNLQILPGLLTNSTMINSIAGLTIYLLALLLVSLTFFGATVILCK